MMMATKNTKAFYNTEIPVDWEVVSLADVCNKFLNGGTPSTQIEEYWKGEIPWVTGADITEQRIPEVRRYISERAVKESSTNIIPKGNLLLVTRTGVGKLTVTPFDVAISQDLTGLILKGNLIYTQFAFYFFDGNERLLKQLNQGTSISGITRSVLEALKIPLPPLPEQKAIAQVLSTADAAIHSTEKLIAQKVLRKKWLMQQLLSEKRIVKNEKWCKSGIRKVTVGEIATVFSGGTPSRKNPDFFKGDIPWIKSGEVNDFEIYDTEEKITDEAVAESSTKVLEPDTILIALYGATAGVVGITRIRAAINQAVLAVIPDEKQVNKMYLLRMLEFNMPKAVENLVQGGQPNLSGGIIFHFPLFIVHSLEEQTAIAQVLQATDKEISLLKMKSEKLKEQKKGLMQVLLTGKKRLIC